MTQLKKVVTEIWKAKRRGNLVLASKLKSDWARGKEISPTATEFSEQMTAAGDKLLSNFSEALSSAGIEVADPVRVIFHPTDQSRVEEADLRTGDNPSGADLESSRLTATPPSIHEPEQTVDRRRTDGLRQNRVLR